MTRAFRGTGRLNGRLDYLPFTHCELSGAKRSITEVELTCGVCVCVLTCTLMLQPLAVVSLLTDAVGLAGVCATLTPGHHVAAGPARLTQGRASRQVLLDVAARGEVWGLKTSTRRDVTQGQTRDRIDGGGGGERETKQREQQHRVGGRLAQCRKVESSSAEKETRGGRQREEYSAGITDGT